MNQKDVNQRQPKPEPPPPPPVAPSAEDLRARLAEVRARLAEVEAEVERATLALVRLWARIVDLKKEG